MAAKTEPIKPMTLQGLHKLTSCPETYKLNQKAKVQFQVGVYVSNLKSSQT